MVPAWFKQRTYRHFDVPVSASFVCRVNDPRFVAQHSWLPLIHYVKQTKRYKPLQGKTVYKRRPIMYASHRDACILSKYAAQLMTLLDEYYDNRGLAFHVIAYRRLGKSNYHFAHDAQSFSILNAPCLVLCFDISRFFDNLNHAILKHRLKRLLNVHELPRDWYVVFRHVTRYSSVSRDTLAGHPVFGPRLKGEAGRPIATIEEILQAGIAIEPNPNGFGIPQGTPISSAFSNLYLTDVDTNMVRICNACGAFYQRYSDDVLIICDADDADNIAMQFEAVISNHQLELQSDKTERILFDPGNPQSFQYLGFNISPDGVWIRSSSLARQWRKAKRSIARVKKVGAAAVAEGRASKIYTKKLRRRFYPVGVRNFSSYARRAAKILGDKTILRQVRRFERMVDRAIRVSVR